MKQVSPASRTWDWLFDMTDRKVTITIAVLCIYLMISLPVAFAQAVSHPITVNIKNKDGTQTLASTELKTFDDLLTREIKATNSSHVKIFVQKRSHPIKTGYIWLCGDLDVSKCMSNEDIRKNPIIMSSDGFDGSRAWVDISKKQTAQYPQTGNILIMVNLEVGKQEVWVGSWNTLKAGTSRIETSLTVETLNVKSLDVLLEDGSTANITKDFIEKNYMLPVTWIKDISSIVFGDVENDPTRAVHIMGFDATDRPDNFESPGKELKSSVDSINFNKQYTFLFPEGSLASPVTAFKNPPPVCGQDSDGDGNKCDSVLGENSDICCQDCVCSGGFTCSTNPKNNKAPGVCLDTSQIRLVYRGAKKTHFKSCEVGNDVELDVEFIGLPSGSKIQDFFYTLNGNKTKTDITSKKDNDVSIKQFYNLKFDIDVSDECGEDKQFTFKNNSISAIVVLPDKTTTTLNTSIDNFTIMQTFVSMNEISKFVSDEMNRLTDKLDNGIKKAEDLLDTCTKFIDKAIDFAYMMIGIAALEALGKTRIGQGLVKPVLNGVTNPLGATGLNGGDYLLGDGGQKPVQKITKTRKGPGGETIYEDTTTTVGGVKDTISELVLGASSILLESVGIAVNVGLNICKVANDLITVYVKISQAMATYTTFQVCVKAYQNMVGQGACSAGDSNNPRASISSALNCVSTLQQCTGYLNQMSSQLEGLDGWADQKIKQYQSSQPKSKRAYLNLIEDGWGETRDTCIDKFVHFDGEDRGCTGDPSVTMEFIGSGAVLQDLSTDIRRIENEALILNNNLIPQLWSVSANVNVGKVKDNIVAATSRVETSARIIRDSQTSPQSSKDLADNILTEAGILKTQVLGTPDRTAVETAASNMLNLIRRLSGELTQTTSKRDITFDVLGGRWSQSVQAREIFGDVAGEWDITFSCPGVGTSSQRIEYITDPQECANRRTGLTTPTGPACGKRATDKLGVEIASIKNANGITLQRQSDCKYYLNTPEMTVGLSNNDIKNAGSLQQIRQCWVNWKPTAWIKPAWTSQKRLLSSNTQDTHRATLTDTTWNKISAKTQSKFTYECEDVSGTVGVERFEDLIIIDKSLSDSQVGSKVPNTGTTGTTPTITNPIRVNVGRSGDYTAVLTLSYPASASIVSVQVVWGDGQTEVLTSSRGGRITHTYPSTQATYTLGYIPRDAQQNEITQWKENNFYTFSTPLSGTGGGANKPPTVSIVSPASLDIANTGAISVSGVATASDVKDSIDKVEVSVEDMSNGATIISNQRATIAANNWDWQLNVNINKGGAYKVKATAFDSNGAQDSQEISDVIVVDPTRPTVVINEPTKTLTGPTNLNTQSVNLDFYILNLQTGTITFVIDWGDGQTENGDVSITSLSAPLGSLTKSHIYNIKGSKRITITATDTRNIQASEFVNIIIQ